MRKDVEIYLQVYTAALGGLAADPNVDTDEVPLIAARLAAGAMRRLGLKKINSEDIQVQVYGMTIPALQYLEKHGVKVA